jgi:hypothetical protein
LYLIKEEKLLPNVLIANHHMYVREILKERRKKI